MWQRAVLVEFHQVHILQSVGNVYKTSNKVLIEFKLAWTARESTGQFHGRGINFPVSPKARSNISFSSLVGYYSLL